jgi:hypothetical protein
VVRVCIACGIHPIGRSLNRSQVFFALGLNAPFKKSLLTAEDAPTLTVLAIVRFTHARGVVRKRSSGRSKSQDEQLACAAVSHGKYAAANLPAIAAAPSPRSVGRRDLVIYEGPATGVADRLGR